MKTFKVSLTKSYIVTIDAENAENAKEFLKSFEKISVPALIPS